VTAPVLIIDDDPTIRTNVSVELTAAGFEVHEEADGHSGLAAIRRLTPDLVLLDWAMPGLSGLEVLQRFRADETVGHIPVLLLAAKAHELELHDGFVAGADDYMIKPFTPGELISRTEALLARVVRLVS
jgi:two-component system phosphate regulon response regulator PhoB